MTLEKHNHIRETQWHERNTMTLEKHNNIRETQ